MREIIYADNAATTKLNIEAFEAMKPFLIEDYSNPSQPYFFSKKSKRAINEARKTIAACINAEPEEIYFTSGGTESDNWAIKCFSNRTDVKTIITSSIEHHAVLNSCKNSNASVEYLKVNNQGEVELSTLKSCFKKPVDCISSCYSRLVSIMLVNNEIGTVQNIKGLASIAHENHCYFHTDAVQAVGHIKIDVKDLDIDMLSASAHKFNGPKGIGFLYIKKGTLITPYNDGGSQEMGMRAGTENVAAIIGMAKALELNTSLIDEHTKYIRQLENALLSNLKNRNINFIRNGSNNRVPGNISLSFPGFEGEALLHRLDLMGVCVSTGSACDSVNTQVSHVLKAINLDKKYALGTIRISINQDNTIEEINKITDSLIKIIRS